MADDPDGPERGSALLEFRAVMARLRAECGWKAAQTHRSLARYLLEETHETLEAIETGSPDDLREELGDLLLQVYFHAAIAEESGAFDLEDVAADVVAKMRRRNPHVFGAASEDDSEDAPGVRPTDPAAVNELWESVKAAEKQRDGVLDGIAPTLPALLLADKVLDRLGRAGGEVDLWPPFLLLPSPFLGPSSLEPLAAWLRARGRRAVTVALGERSPGAVLEAALARAAELGPLVLVTHSNAGLHAPLLATRTDVLATVHVDAALPGSPGPAPLATPGLRSLLADRTADGSLPVWTRWWDPAELAALAPPEVLRSVEADQPAVPAAYLDATVEVPTGWERAPAAYVALGDTYAGERAAAAGHGWPVRTVPGGHLHPVVDPEAVGTAVLALADELTGPVDTGPRLLALVADARARGVDPEQALRELARGLAASSQGPRPPQVSPAGW